ncbi:bifunctional adenosylcobinamide kinase/adenosylcobinamide-phosphate guanylyltransferase [Sporosarcina sp. HYO08]|uniref:bifunctional adenosylcobinamide kinase/adenosylcobinamide-phosphate guanylyltransferase n=1 Tax=Sporosarcina sp. HYO08 TaxID=1759557 RepID=UPI0007953745|nr:bifunctional adenosylcobinamide kinase/adenosylcobinamide-phosphate guanylyltransferase [Sporosarcina sp. HYO08]KXH83944.1 hypothetical protein AU377_04105 [Sporosarcina sp. HYO08]
MESGKLTFISGGVRSGKSAYAEKLLVNEARKNGHRLVYIASGVSTDEEMQKRIEKHQQDRAVEQWITIEQPIQLEKVLPFIQRGDCVLWDCLTTWLANEMYAGWEVGKPCIEQPHCFDRKVERLFETIEEIQRIAAHFVIVSNEVLNDWPMYDASMEKFLAWIGKLHQSLVTKANTAIEMNYGIATMWKEEKL